MSQQEKWRVRRRERASKKFSLSRKLRIRKGVERCIRKTCEAFLAAKELKVMRAFSTIDQGVALKKAKGAEGSRPELQI